MTPARALASLILALTSFAANALTVEPYSPEAVSHALSAKKAIAFDFHADWCPTCKAQAKSIEKLKSAPNLDVTIFVVDFDKNTALRKQLKVAAQSTIVVFKEGRESARLIGQTEVEQIRSVLQTAL